MTEPGSDQLLREIAPDSKDVISGQLYLDNAKWFVEQEWVRKQPIHDDPGEDHPERPPI